MKSRMCLHFAAVSLITLSSTAASNAQNTIVGVGYAAPAFLVAPGQVVTLFTSPLNVTDAVANQIPLPTALSGVTVSVRVVGARDSTGYPASLPILRVYSSSDCQRESKAPCPSTQITVQIPNEGVCARPPSLTCSGTPIDLPPALILNVKAGGMTGPDLTLLVGTTAPHFLNSCDSIFGAPNGDCHTLITHPDGTLVNSDSPAHVGEVITIYAVGLNDRPQAPIRFGKTGYPAETPVPLDPALTQIKFSYRIPPIAGSQFDFYAPIDGYISPEWVGLTSGYVGLFQINVKVPPMLSGTSPCQGAYNASITLQVLLSGTVYLCVQPQ
jgi:hypothetical protein